MPLEDMEIIYAISASLMIIEVHGEVSIILTELAHSLHQREGKILIHKGIGFKLKA